MLVAKRYDVILFLSRARGTGKHDSDTRVHNPVFPKKQADAIDFDAITRSKGVRRVRLTYAVRDQVCKEGLFFNCRELVHMAREYPERLDESKQ